MICDPTLKNRIKRTQGQMQGVLKMMESDSGCLEILNQLKAIRAGIDKAIGILTTSNLIQMIEKTNDIKINNLDDAIDLIVKGIK
ncbi:MAG: metal-sensing transcriptional repressor [Candidatus Izemoplasmatales bacterium]|jgi:DNA-binding FrmR family transcriptional regulator|nr:metal-sensing transcriptional repressor [Candidatus Izemoplasmatales bacterium]MDD4355259.1 metal-sensing transcriptional repressor [Candidatus Izemoplasmatales bacterium]MDD4988320.1 metal-sensing transcriptional repressor [Candidatus Izemoplasmatales bacterium]MDY0373039.1 metal-sensing transcriptional repressor [Candidatus Izemoplasmatales bacterium]